MINAEKATENLEKKYKRIQKIANDSINKNIVYQNDIIAAEKRIDEIENKFNNLVEDFQRYINQREEERSRIVEKQSQIQNSFAIQHQNKQSTIRNDETFKDDQYPSLHFDTEEKNIATKIYDEIVEDYRIPQERDEAILDTIEKYIYDKKQPNIAHGIWECADFAH